LAEYFGAFLFLSHEIAVFTKPPCTGGGLRQ